MDYDNLEMHMIIKGQREGVGFRAMTIDYAKTLGITGTVYNLPYWYGEIYVQEMIE